MKILTLMAAGACVWAQSGVERPALGLMIDATGFARPVYGVMGSVTLGEDTGAAVLSLACSRALCLMKTDGALVSNGEAIAAPPGPALFAFDGEAAFVYFPQTKQLVRFHHGQLDQLAFDVQGEILALRATRGALEFATRREDGIWIVRDGNLIVDSLPDDASGPVFLLEGGVAFSTPDALVLHRADASEIRFKIAGIETSTRMSDAYLQVRAGSAMYALRVEPGREQICLLPEPPQ